MKLILKILALLALGLVLLIVAGMVLVPPASRKALEVGASHALGVPAHVDEIDADLGFSSSRLGFEGFRVDNPEGFGDEPLLSIGSFHVGVGTRSLFGDAVEVPGIDLDGMELAFVQKGARSNFTEVLENVRRLTSGTSAEPAAGEPSDGDGPGMLIDVRRVSITGIKASFRVEGVPGLPDDEWTFDVPPLQLQFAEGDTKMPLSELCARLLDKVADSAVDQAGGVLPPGALQSIEGALGAVEERVQEEVRGKVDELRGEAEKKLGDKLKGVFGKD